MNTDTGYGIWHEVFLTGSIESAKAICTDLIPALFSPVPVDLDAYLASPGYFLPSLPCLLAQQSLADLPQRFELLADLGVSLTTFDSEGRSPIYTLLANRKIPIQLKLRTYDTIWSRFEKDFGTICNVFEASGDSVLSQLCRLGAEAQALELYRNLRKWAQDQAGISYFSTYLAAGAGPKLSQNEAYKDFLSTFIDLGKAWSKAGYPIHPLEAAIKSGHLDLVSALLAAGMSLKAMSSSGFPLLSLIVQTYSAPALRKLLETVQGEVPFAVVERSQQFLTYERETGNSVLSAIVRRGDLEIASILVDFLLKNCQFDGKQYGHFVKGGDQPHFHFPLLVKQASAQLLPILLPTHLLSSSSYQRLYLRILDSALAANRSDVLTALTRAPPAQSLLLNPRQAIPNTKFLSKLHLYYNITEYRENINEDFLKNSLLLVAVNHQAGLEVVRALVEMGCSVINEELEAGKHVIDMQNYHIMKEIVEGYCRNKAFYPVFAYFLGVLLDRSERHSQYYAEISIGIDMFSLTIGLKPHLFSGDSDSFFQFYQNLLEKGVLFTKCYKFGHQRDSFWSEKLGILLSMLIHAGKKELLRTTIDQFYASIEQLSSTEVRNIEKLASDSMITAKFRPWRYSKVGVLQVSQCLYAFITSFDACDRLIKPRKYIEWLSGQSEVAKCEETRQEMQILRELLQLSETTEDVSVFHVLAKYGSRVEEVQRYLCYRPQLRTAIEETNAKEAQGKVWPLAPRSLIFAFEVACKHANSETVAVLLAAQLQFPTWTWAWALLSCLCGDYPEANWSSRHAPICSSEIPARMELTRLVLEGYLQRLDDPTCSDLPINKQSCVEHRFRFPLIAAAAFYPADFIAWLIAKGLDPQAQFQYTLTLRHAEKTVTSSVLREALLYNTEETVLLVLAAMREVAEQTVDECLFLAAERGLWTAVKDMMTGRDCGNAYVVKEVIVCLARDNRGDLLPLFLKPGKTVDVSYAVSKAILNHNVDFLFQLVAFYRYTSINSSSFTSLSFSPDIQPIVQLCDQLLLPKYLSDRSTPLHVLSRLGISSLVSVVMNNSAGLLENELKGDEPIVIAAASGFCKVVDVYLDYLAAAQCDISQYVRKALGAAILGKWGSQYNIKVPHYIPKAVLTGQVAMRYHKHYNAAQYQTHFKVWAKVSQSRSSKKHLPAINEVRKRHYRDSAEAITAFQEKVRKTRKHNELVQRTQDGSEEFTLFHTKRMAVTRGIPAASQPPSTYQHPYTCFQYSGFSEEEEVAFPSLQQNLDETILSLASQLSPQALCASTDLLPIAAFYGEKIVLERLSLQHLSAGALLKLLTEMVNGYIYLFSPLFCSFYQSTWARHTFTIPCNYPSPQARTEHRQWWLAMMGRVAEVAGGSALQEAEIPAELRMSYLHIFYSSLHYLLLPIIVPLYPMAEKLGIDRSVYSVILLTAARYSDMDSIKALIDMGANPNWSHTIPSWVSVPRYDARNETFERESESLGPWSDSESSLLSAGVEKADLNSSRQLPTALHWACENQNVEMAQFLLNSKALKGTQVPLSLLKPQPQQRSFKTLQVTPLDVACLRGNWELIQVLRGDEDLTAKHFNLIVKSGNVEAFRAAAAIVPNALGIIKDRRFLARAVKHGKRPLADEVLNVYIQSGLIEEIAAIKTNRETILHYCALSNMPEFAAKLHSLLSAESWSHLCQSLNSYDFSPYLIARLVSHMDAELLQDQTLTDWTAGLISKHALCTSVFDGKSESPGAMYSPDSNEMLRSSALFSRLYWSLACKNTKMTHELVTNTPMFIKVLSHFSTVIAKSAEKILLERAIKSGDLSSALLLIAMELPLSPEFVLSACKYGRDEIGLRILRALNLPPDHSQLLPIAQEACHSGCIQVVNLLITQAPGLFVTKMVHSPLEIALVSGKPEVFILITQHCLSTGLLDGDQLLTYLKLESDSPVDYLRAMSDLLRQKVMLELGVSGLLGENPWPRIMESYGDDPKSRMICRDKLLLHISGAAGLHQAVNALREYLSAPVQPALPCAKQDALVEALKITRDKDNPELVCNSAGVRIYLRPEVLQELPSEGWEHYFAIVNLFSSSGVLGVFEAVKQTTAGFSVEVYIESKADLTITYPESNRAVITTSPVIDAPSSDHPLFRSVHSCYLPISPPLFPILQSQELDSCIAAYLTSLSAVSKRIGIEGLEVSFLSDSITQTDCPFIIPEFALAKTDWTNCPACGLTSLLLKMRDLMKEENGFYERFTYDLGVEREEESSSPAQGSPGFFRSASTRLRLSFNEPAEDLVRHFERIAVDGLRVKMLKVSTEELDRTIGSENWLFAVDFNGKVHSSAYVFRPYAELKLKTISHRLISLFKFEMEQFKRNIEFNIPSLLDGIGVPIAQAAVSLGLSPILTSPVHLVQLFLSSFRTQRWTHTLVRICMQHFYIVEECRAVLIEAKPHFVSQPFSKGVLIDRIARIEGVSYEFRGRFLCVLLQVAVANSDALSSLVEIASSPPIDFTGFPVYSHEKVVFLEQLLSKELIIEEELKKISIQHMLDLYNQSLSEELGVDMQVSINWQSLVDEVKGRLPLIGSAEGSVHSKGWEFQLIGELSMKLESKEFWMQLAQEYTTVDWDDLNSFKMNCGQYPAFRLGAGFKTKEKTYGRIALNGYHNQGLRRSYLLDVDPQNIDMLNVEKCRLLLFTSTKFVCELQQYESDQLTVLVDKRETQIPIKNIKKCFVVFAKYPSEDQLKYSKVPVLVSDSVGRVWKVRKVVLPAYVTKEGLYSEGPTVPSWGELTRPFPTNPALNFSSEEDGIRGLLHMKLTPMVRKAALRANPKCYLCLDNSLEEAKTTLNRRFAKLRAWAQVPDWQIKWMYRLDKDCMQPVKQIWADYSHAARERLLYVFFSLYEALEGLVFCRKSRKSYRQSLFVREFRQPGGLLSHQVALIVQKYLTSVIVLLTFEESPIAIDLTNGHLTLKVAFQSDKMLDELSIDSISHFLINNILTSELNQPIKSSEVVKSRLLAEREVFDIEDLLLLSVFPLLFVSCQHCACLFSSVRFDLDLIFNEETRKTPWKVHLEANSIQLEVYSNTHSTTISPTFTQLLTYLNAQIHPSEACQSRVKFSPRDQMSLLAIKDTISLETQGEALDSGLISCLAVDWDAPERLLPTEVSVEDSIVTVKLPDSGEKRIHLLVFYKNRLKFGSSVVTNGEMFSGLYDYQPKYAVFTPISFLVDLSSPRRVRFSVPTHFSYVPSVGIRSFSFELVTIYAYFFGPEINTEKEIDHMTCWRATERFAIIQFASCSMDKKYLCAVSNRSGYLLKVFKAAFAPGTVAYSELKFELLGRQKSVVVENVAKFALVEPVKVSKRYSLFGDGLLLEFKEGFPDSQSARVVSEASGPAASVAGAVRHDWLEARDKLDNKIVDGEWAFQPEFRHIGGLHRYPAEVINRDNGLYELSWTPLKQGRYFLYIDGTRVPKTPHFLIMNSTICPANCLILADKSCYIGEKNVFHIRLRDAYENIYSTALPSDSPVKFCGDLQINEDFRLTASFLSPDEESPCTLYAVDQRGLVKVEGVIEFKEWLKLKVEINGQGVKNSPYLLRLQPMRYQTKHKKFMKACRALPGYRTEQNVSVNRTEFLQELLTTFNLDEPRGTLWVKWKNEPGYDAGGLRREFFDKLSREIVKAESHVFRQHGGYVKPDPLADKHHSDVHRLFSVVGMLCARAAIHQILLDISFAPSIYKVLLGKTLSPVDLKDDDPELWASLEAIKSLDAEVLDGAGLYFTATQYDQSVVELVPSGGDIQVTVENREEYIAKRALWHIYASVQPMMDAFREGFHEAVPLRILSIFESDELPKVINGSTEFSVAFLKKRTRYELCGSQTREIRWLWTWLESASEQVIKGFLRFTTGSARIPFNDRHWSLTVNRTFGSDILPRASTCSNTIYIPLYGTYKQMAKFMTIAVLEGSEGFGDT